MKKDLLITFVTEALVLICGLLVYRFAKTQLGTEGFAIYALCRRTHSFIAPALLMGCGVAIPRYVAFSKVKDPEAADSYFKSGALIVGCCTLLFLLVANIVPEFAAGIMLGDRKEATLITALSVMMIGYMLHLVSYTFFRGHCRMVWCNLLQIVNMALVPLVSMLLSSAPETVLRWTGYGWVATGGSMLLLVILPQSQGKMSRTQLREVFCFGVQRVPADFGAAALFGLPATLTAHASGIVAGGNVAFSISLLSMSGAAFAPIGLVLLPKASAAVANKDSALIRRYVKLALLGAVSVSLLIMIVFEASSSLILHLYLGHSVAPGLIEAAKLAMLAAVPYAIYVAVRSLVDSFYTKAINTFNIFVSLVLFLVLSAGAFTPAKLLTPLTALTVAIFFLGISTLVACLFIAKQQARVVPEQS